MYNVICRRGVGIFFFFFFLPFPLGRCGCFRAVFFQCVTACLLVLSIRLYRVEQDYSCEIQQILEKREGVVRGKNMAEYGR